MKNLSTDGKNRVIPESTIHVDQVDLPICWRLSTWNGVTEVTQGQSPLASTLLYAGTKDGIKDMIETEEFAGAHKTNTSFLSPLERRLAPIVIPRIPKWLETYHLTMLTLVWSLLILVFSFMAARNLRWLWMVSLMIFLQWVTDHYDGKVGKYRNTGLVRWGYYMDHFLDYVFLCSIIIGYAFILPEQSRFQLLLTLVLFAAYDFSTFLAFAATDKLQISYLKFGPTEFRLALIIINGLIASYGIRHMIGGLKYVNAGAAVGLCFLVYRTQKNIWKLDMKGRPSKLFAKTEPLLEKSYVAAKECTF